jgi:hypothetical protein
MPVTLPPGRFVFATRPESTMSPLPATTMGMVEVACRAARPAGVDTATMTST